VDLAITFVILDTLNIFMIDWLIDRIRIVLFPMTLSEPSRPRRCSTLK